MYVKKMLISILITSVLFLNSCVFGGNSRLYDTEPMKADTRTEEIVSAIKDKDSKALKSLFSKQALMEEKKIDTKIDDLFEFLEGNIISWERNGWASDQSADHGKITLMIRFSITINTDKDDYVIYVIDYNTDTIYPNNEGVYMLELSRASYSGEWGSWQSRMCAGISIFE